MISLEQIRTLENKVHGAVERIKSLTAENDALTEKLSDYERRIDELQAMVSEFKTGQEEIERGIMSALSQLDGLEDQVSSETPPNPDTPEVTTVALNSDPDTGSELTDQGESAAGDESDTQVEGNDDESMSSESSENTPPPNEPEEPRATVELIESDEEEPELDIF